MHILKSIKQKYDGLRPRAKGAVWFICAVFFQNALSIIATPIYSRLFTLEEAGNYSLYYTWYNCFVLPLWFWVWVFQPLNPLSSVDTDFDFGGYSRKALYLVFQIQQ